MSVQKPSAATERFARYAAERAKQDSKQKKYFRNGKRGYKNIIPINTVGRKDDNTNGSCINPARRIVTDTNEPN